MTTRTLRLLRAGLLATALCSALHAQAAVDCPATPAPASAEQTDAARRDARDQGFLWRISKAGRTSWLYGTIHVGRFGWTFPGPQVEAALRASDTIALEIDTLDAEMQRRLQQALVEPSGGPYAAVSALPAELRARLQRVSAAECVPADLLDPLPPAFATGVLAGLTVRRDGLDAAYGVDNALAARGHREQRSVVSLETPELQVAAMRVPGTPAETLQSVATALDDIEGDRARPLLRRVAQLWADGDWSTFSAYASWCDCMNTAAERAEMKRILDDRNPGMAAKVDALHLGGHTVFAAVGALHMIGPTGLPALMARRGYRVERIVYQQKPQETRP
jgi:uncharacterized protein YbaP (TraB family)